MRELQGGSEGDLEVTINDKFQITTSIEVEGESNTPVSSKMVRATTLPEYG